MPRRPANPSNLFTETVPPTDSNFLTQGESLLVTRRRKLLLADDSLTIQKVVSLTFADEGVEVVAVGDGRQALSRLEEDDALPDVVLADVLMPVLDGYELCRRIKADSRFRHIPVMLLVGAFEHFNEAEARRVGADDVLTKPFQSIRGLVSRVGSLLGGAEQKQEEPEPSREERRETAEAPPPRRNADAAPAAPAVVSPRREVPAEIVPPVLQDSSASFADLGMDDQMIEAKPADSFRNPTEQTSFTTQIPETSPLREDASGDAPSYVQAEVDEWAAGEAGAQAFVPAREERNDEVFAARSTFDTHVADAAVADETLLDLGGIEATSTVAGDEGDDFILDLDDDPPSRPGFASHDTFETGELELNELSAGEPERLAASSGVDAPGAFAEAAHGEEPLAYSSQDFDFSSLATDTHQESVMPGTAHEEGDEAAIDGVLAQDFDGLSAQDSGDVFGQDADEVQGGNSDGVLAQDGAQFYEVPFASHEEEEPTISSFAAVEPTVVPAEEPSVAAGDESTYTDGSVEGDTVKPPFDVNAEQPQQQSAMQATGAAGSVAETASAGVISSAAQAGAGQLIGLEQLSPEAVDAIARRAVEMLSEKVVQQVVWEVVPDLAELLIKRRLEEETHRR